MTIPIHSGHTPHHPETPLKTIVDATRFEDYTDTHPLQYSAQSTTPPNYHQHRSKHQNTPSYAKGPLKQGMRGGGQGGSGIGEDVVPQHDEGIGNDVTHAELQRRKGVVVNKILEHQHSDRPSKTTRHKRKPDK
jgi:hypothetical protein